jgi:hypothetical protein
MPLSQYLTEYDEDLSGDSQIDPLGEITCSVRARGPFSRSLK